MAEIFHTLNRGVDKRKIFMDDSDRLRFVHDLFEFNDEDRVNNALYRFRNYKDIACPYIAGRKKRKMLVDIHAFCLMPNHYHLLLSPKREKEGISKFMKKVNMGYAKYFNEKYDRKGTLFEGRYKSIAVTQEPHFIHLPYYIHLNPLDLAYPEWRERELKSRGKAVKFLESYRWSSHLDYLGKKNFPSVTNRNMLLEIFGGNEGYKKSMNAWLNDLDMKNVQNISLE